MSVSCIRDSDALVFSEAICRLFTLCSSLFDVVYKPLSGEVRTNSSQGLKSFYLNLNSETMFLNVSVCDDNSSDTDADSSDVAVFDCVTDAI